MVRVSAIQSTFAVSATIVFVQLMLKRLREKKRQTSLTYDSLIGNTPLLYLQKLSTLVGRKIYVKMESSNPGGTGKDRAALFMLMDAEQKGHLPPSLANCYPPTSTCSYTPRPKCTIAECSIKSTATSNTSQNDVGGDFAATINMAIKRTRTGGIVCEGTSGSTGISLATLCAQRGHAIILVLPDDQAEEKRRILQCLGAVVHVTQNTAISNPNHYVNIARRIAEEINSHYVTKESKDGVGENRSNELQIKALFTNQFENVANYLAHYTTTGPEIWSQCGSDIGAFCMSSGTGGTISGVGKYLKEKSSSHMRRNNECKVVLIDPPGSALYNKVKFNVAYTSQQCERSLRRHRYDTIAEGIGLDRVTKNFSLGVDSNSIDDALRISDQEAVDIAHWLLREEGLFVGSSSAMNIVGAAKLASGACGDIKVDKSIVTVVCDGGQRHLSRFWNRDFIHKEGLHWPDDDVEGWYARLYTSILQR